MQRNESSVTKLDEIKMRFVPFEDPDIKLKKIDLMFQSHDSGEKFTPLYIYNILNQFQSFGCLSSDASAFQIIWQLFISFIFASSPFQNIDKNLEFIISLLEEKPRLNSQFILLLKEINNVKSHPEISSEIHKKLKTVFLQKHFEDLKQHLLIIDYLIVNYCLRIHLNPSQDKGFHQTLIDSLSNFKKMFLSGEANEKEIFTIARSLFHLVRTTSPKNDISFLNQIIQILHEIMPIDNAYIKEECQLLSQFLQVLPQDTMQNFLDSTTVETKECFSLLSQEGHAEHNFTKEQFYENFNFSIFSHKRKEQGVDDNGVSFVIDEIHQIPKIIEIGSLEQLQSEMDNLIHNDQSHYFYFQIELQRKNCDSQQKLPFPLEIFNMEFNFPSAKDHHRQDICRASIHIPYLSQSPPTIETQLVFDFHSNEPGSLEALVSFTNYSGDIYYGTVPLVPLKFQDFFIHSPTPQIKFKDDISQWNQKLPSPQLSEAESFLLFFYHYLQEKHCKHESFKIIRQPMENILAKFTSYLKFFEVHTPYNVSDQDSLGLEYQNLLYQKSKKTQISSSTLKLKTQQQTILRVIIKLPAKNYLLMYFKVKKFQSEINIYTTTLDVFKYLDEYFDMWN